MTANAVILSLAVPSKGSSNFKKRTKTMNATLYVYEALF